MIKLISRNSSFSETEDMALDDRLSKKQIVDLENVAWLFKLDLALRWTNKKRYWSNVSTYTVFSRLINKKLSV